MRSSPTFVPACLLALAMLVPAAPSRAALSGPITEPWWSFPAGGAAGTSGGNYRVMGAVGASVRTKLAGGLYQVSAGFWSLPYGGLLEVDPGPVPPARFAFAAPSPNPFAAATRLTFTLPTRGRVRAEVFDVRGDRVRTLVDAVREAGVWSEAWDGTGDSGRPVGAGVYFVRVRAAAGDATHRVVRIP